MITILLETVLGFHNVRLIDTDGGYEASLDGLPQVTWQSSNIFELVRTIEKAIVYMGITQQALDAQLDPVRRVWGDNPHEEIKQNLKDFGIPDPADVLPAIDVRY